MRCNDKDKDDYLLLSLFVLGILVQIWDMLLTMAGINLGFQEGNPLVVLVMSLMDPMWALALYSAVAIAIYAVLYAYIRKDFHRATQRIKTTTYVALITVLLFRMFVLGLWVGSIGTRAGMIT